MAAVATTSNAVLLIDLRRKKVSRVDAIDSPVLDLRFAPTGGELIVLHAARLAEYELKSLVETKWSTNCVPNQWSKIDFVSAPCGIATVDSGSFFVYSSEKAILVERRKGDGEKSEEPLRHRDTTKFRHLVFVGCLSEGELLAVQMEEREYVSRLPPALKLKKFGMG